MKVLITGATGFLGEHLTRKCLYDPDIEQIITIGRRPMFSQTPKITYYNCDLGSLSQDEVGFYCLDGICKQHKPDVIFHLASKSTVKEETNPYKIHQDNLISTHKVINSAPEGCRVVLASTVIVYGDWWVPIHETCDESLATKPTSTYGITKRASESLIESYTNMGKINGVSARMCATVGEGLTHGVVKDFIRKLKSDNPYLEALGDAPGSNKPYSHVNDTINALVLLGKSNATGEFNVAPDDSITIEEVGRAVMEGCGIEKPIKWLGEGANWKGDNKKISINNSKLKGLGWSLEYPSSYKAISDVVRSIC